MADRRWLLDGRAGRDLGSPQRLRTGLDTLIENAIRYTSVGDTIRLVGSRNQPGAEPAADTEADAPTETEEGLAGTGLELSIVRAFANARGGTLHASHAPDGGAAMILTFPLDERGGIGSFLPRDSSNAAPVKPDMKAHTRLVAPGLSKS